MWVGRCEGCAAAEERTRETRRRPDAETAKRVARLEAAERGVKDARQAVARRTLIAKIAPFNYSTELPAKSRGQGCIREVLVNGAFRKAIAAGQVVADIDHGDATIARQSDGTLKLWEAGDGLYAELQVTPALAARVERGAFGGCSFAFQPSEFDEQGLAGQCRPIKPLRLVDLTRVSLISSERRPVYEGTWVRVKA